ncbi:MAG: esterase-like activity of phytase family protein, partial [Aestuariivirga sp.]
SLPGMAIRRLKTSAIAAGTTVEPELLFSGRIPLYAIDNMEGIALCRRDGETRLTIVSDNNLNPALQRTLLLQFAYEP